MYRILDKKEPLKIQCPFEMGIQNAEFQGTYRQEDFFLCTCERVEQEKRFCGVYKNSENKGGEKKVFCCE